MYLSVERTIGLYNLLRNQLKVKVINLICWPFAFWSSRCNC